METTANGYRVVYEGGEGEIVEKKSRFIATVQPIETEEEAVAFINEMKKKYWDARHNCSAFVIGSRQEITRCSDDGEPAQTAGCIASGGDYQCGCCGNPIFWRCTAWHRWTGTCVSVCHTGRTCSQQNYRETPGKEIDHSYRL